MSRLPSKFIILSLNLCLSLWSYQIAINWFDGGGPPARCSTQSRFHAIVEAMGRGIEADRRFYRTLFTRSVLNFGNVRADRILSDVSAALMREGQRRGEISAEYDPHELADIFIGTYYAVIIRWLHGYGGRSLTERLHNGAAIFLAGVAPSPPGVAERRAPGRRAGSHS